MTVQNDEKLKLKAATLSFSIGIVLLGAKYFAWVVTGSAAVLSDAAESIINVVASGFAWLAIRASAIPADRNHPYGHGKTEYFSAGFEGALIFIAALAILAKGVEGLIDPPQIQQVGVGLGITAAAAFVNAGLGFYLIRVGKSANSLALEADGVHLITDVVTSIGVIFSLVVVKFTGTLIVDPIVACVLALNILVSGYKLLRQSAGRLLDEADDDVLDKIVNALNEERKPGDLEPHQLRARVAGSRLDVDFHIFMPRFWELTKVHERSDEIHNALRQRVQNDLEAIIHVDPCRPEHCASCELSDCHLREHEPTSCDVWTAAQIRSLGERHD